MEGVNVGFRFNTFSSSITRPANTTAYAAGDVISAVTTDEHFTFGAVSNDDERGLTRTGINTGTLNSLRLVSSANQATKLQGELWLFSQDITEVADNSAFAPSDAEVATCVAVIDISSSDWREGTATTGADGNAIAVIDNLDIPIRVGGTYLYAQLVARNAYTPVSGEIFTAILGWSKD